MNAVSIGSLVKKLIAINPKLSTHELIEIVRQSTETRKDADGYRTADFVNEEKAINLTKALLQKRPSSHP